MDKSLSTTNRDNTTNDKELRLKYYQGIKGKGDFSKTFIAPPPHWLAPNIFSIVPQYGIQLNFYFCKDK